MHLIASFAAIKVLVTHFASKSIILTILSQAAIYRMLLEREMARSEIGSANLNT